MIDMEEIQTRLFEVEEDIENVRLSAEKISETNNVLARLEQEVNDMRFVLRQHKHLGFDDTTKLSEPGALNQITLTTSANITALNAISAITSAAAKSNATSNDSAANNFIGFALHGATSGDPVIVQVSGVVTGFTGLTAGSTYYLSDTAGAISTSAGSQSRKIGIAINATTILIKHDNV